MSGGCGEEISHSWYGLGLGQALLLAAAVDEVMGLLCCVRANCGNRVEESEVVERKGDKLPLQREAVIARKSPFVDPGWLA